MTIFVSRKTGRQFINLRNDFSTVQTLKKGTTLEPNTVVRYLDWNNGVHKVKAKILKSTGVVLILKIYIFFVAEIRLTIVR